ncbi:MAG: CoA pyrophosphatase [Wenzhouxiangellaceae bacterium]|nr:CoA pyrophosphatase [Wenzhouxiangellaceae bacterium]
MTDDHSRESIRARLTASLHPLASGLSGLPRGGHRAPHREAQRAAAVLVPVLTGSDHEVLLTVRSDRLSQHPGQVAFPGGRREDQDRHVVDTALREAHEETGLLRDRVDPLGFLDRYDTITGYRMTAVVGWVADPNPLEPDGREIAELFTVPLEHVADPDRYRCDRVRHAGKTFEILTLEHPEYRIWGATAAILADLGRRLRGEN